MKLINGPFQRTLKYKNGPFKQHSIKSPSKNRLPFLWMIYEVGNVFGIM